LEKQRAETARLAQEREEMERLGLKKDYWKYNSNI